MVAIRHRLRERPFDGGDLCRERGRVGLRAGGRQRRRSRQELCRSERVSWVTLWTMTLEQRLEAYAELTVRVALNVQQRDSDC